MFAFFLEFCPLNTGLRRFLGGTTGYVYKRNDPAWGHTMQTAAKFCRDDQNAHLPNVRDAAELKELSAATFNYTGETWPDLALSIGTRY